MESLLRTRVDRFCLKDSLKLSEIEALRDEGTIEQYVEPVDKVFEKYPSLFMEERADKLLHNGNPFAVQDTAAGDEPLSGWIRVYDSEKRFIGIYEFDMEKERYQPRKLFLPVQEGSSNT